MIDMQGNITLSVTVENFKCKTPKINHEKFI